MTGQIIKLVGGAAQFVLGGWLIAMPPRPATRIWFAVAYALNGVAYFLFNLSAPGHRTPGSLALEGRALFNWLAAAAMFVFAATLLGRITDRPHAIPFALGITIVVVIADVLAAQQFGLSLATFGGIAIYPATACVLGLLPFWSEAPFASAFLTAALAINSVDHLGAELVRPSPTEMRAVLLQIAVMLAVGLVWLWKMEPIQPRWLSILVAACFVVPFVAGYVVRVETGSYIAVQRSGLVGIGRIVATALLFYSFVRNADVDSQSLSG